LPAASGEPLAGFILYFSVFFPCVFSPDMTTKNLRGGNKYVPSILSGLLLGLSLPNFSYLPLGFLTWVWLVPLLLELRKTENFRDFFSKTLIALSTAFVTIMLWVVNATVIGFLIAVFVGIVVYSVPFLWLFLARQVAGWKAALWTFPIVWTAWEWLFHRTELSLGTIQHGVAADITLDAGGNIGIAGTHFHSSRFGIGGMPEQTINSYDRGDMFFARYDANGNFQYVKPIVGSGVEGINTFGGSHRLRAQDYIPITLTFANNSFYLTGDFRGMIALDCTTLSSEGARRAFIAKLNDEPSSCRIWNGSGWNGNVAPQNGDAAYLRYNGSQNAPLNLTNTALSSLTIGEGQRAQFNGDLTVNNQLSLLGGIIDAGANTLILPQSAVLQRHADSSNAKGYILGKLKKSFAAGAGENFTFPVGTANGYSPVNFGVVSSDNGALTVSAMQSAHPNSPSTIYGTNRYWTLTKIGNLSGNLTFNYLDTDVLNGNESLLRLFKYQSGTGLQLQLNAVINTNANTASLANVSSFSDWFLGAVLPTVAPVQVNGRIMTSAGRGISGVRVSLTDLNGNTRTALTNAFGYYRFADIAVGNYVLSVQTKRFEFTDNNRAINVQDEINDANFIAK